MIVLKKRELRKTQAEKGVVQIASRDHAPCPETSCVSQPIAQVSIPCENS
jgi:hypothetical protein